MSNLRVRESGDFGKYHVQSESNPETFYEVDLFDMEANCKGTCKCPDHEMRGNYCKHLQASEKVYRKKWGDAGMKAGERYCRAGSKEKIIKLLGELWKHLFSQKQPTKRKDNE